ncbi:hypothetical protein HZ326_3609 [Fusarium oxysporum f. sp. albedinis]|nr:hypothetical protein HZ326_3609 [Fusarium oxysporum f. sp. albedinis]
MNKFMAREVLLQPVGLEIPMTSPDYKATPFRSKSATRNYPLQFQETSSLCFEDRAVLSSLYLLWENSETSDEVSPHLLDL